MLGIHNRQNRVGTTNRSFAILAEFVGPKVLWLGGVALSTGLALFGVELLFSYVLQGFLGALGVALPSVLRLPVWLALDNIWAASGWLALAGTVRGFVNATQKYAQHAVVHDYIFLQRKRLIRWALSSKKSNSSMVTHLFDGACNGGALAVQGVLQFALHGASSLLIGAYLLYISPVLTLSMGVVLAVLNLPMRNLNQYCDQLGSVASKDSAVLVRRLMLGIRNLLFLQIYGAAPREAEIATSALARVRKGNNRFVLLNALSQLYPNLIGPMVMAGVAIFGREYLSLEPGLLISYFYLVFRLFQGISSLAMAASQMRFYSPQHRELFNWWREECLEEARGQRVIAPSPISKQFTENGFSSVGFKIEQASFRYTDSDSIVLRGVSAVIPAGTAWVCRGESGSGKSTLLSLLLGQIEPTTGTVSIVVGTNELKASQGREVLYGRIGYVGPEPFIIDGTIRENLLYALEDTQVSELRLREALALAECQFVWQSSLGLDHVLTEQGLGLSAGQKQRLALARALLRNPEVLVLDEATANLDFETEKRLVTTLGALKGRMTILIVTHRLALAEIADHQTLLS